MLSTRAKVEVSRIATERIAYMLMQWCKAAETVGGVKNEVMAAVAAMVAEGETGLWQPRRLRTLQVFSVPEGVGCM